MSNEDKDDPPAPTSAIDCYREKLLSNVSKALAIEICKVQMDQMLNHPRSWWKGLGKKARSKAAMYNFIRNVHILPNKTSIIDLDAITDTGTRDITHSGGGFLSSPAFQATSKTSRYVSCPMASQADSASITSENLRLSGGRTEDTSIIEDPNWYYWRRVDSDPYFTV